MGLPRLLCTLPVTSSPPKIRVSDWGKGEKFLLIRRYLLYGSHPATLTGHHELAQGRRRTATTAIIIPPPQSHTTTTFSFLSRVRLFASPPCYRSTSMVNHLQTCTQKKKPTQQQKAPKPPSSTSTAKPLQDASATTCTSLISTATNLREAQTRVTQFLYHLQPQLDLQDKTQS
ncbi:hypothetical protein V8G54_027431 [Vigna mungo]|uniref:Uncharacterized protein n=1 Tax=Vigna mungo TaxID=3915 RepID=A0AAQ3N271_VIGMU